MSNSEDKSVRAGIDKEVKQLTPLAESNHREEDLLRLLQMLRRDCQALSDSPRRIVLEHAIRACQSILNNQLELEWHRRLYEQAFQQNLGLAEQLALVLELLEISSPPDPDDGGDGANANTAAAEEATIIRRCWRNIERWLKSSFVGLAGTTVNCAAASASELVVLDAPSPSASDRAATTSNGGDDMRLASLEVYCFGAFRLYQDREPIESWPKGRAKQLLKYLILNRASPIPKEVLMDRFWPDLEESSARNNLNVAVYGLRQSLKKEGSKFLHVLFQDGCYLLNPDLGIWVDIDAFDRALKLAARLEAQGRIDQAIGALNQAEQLYQGDFLAEDLYEDWTAELREGYRSRYLDLLRKLSECQFRKENYEACTDINRKLLALDQANEFAHRRVMECYACRGQRHLALRQFGLCRDALAKEFGLKPAPETTSLFERIRTHADSGATGAALGSDAALRLRNA